MREPTYRGPFGWLSRKLSYGVGFTLGPLDVQLGGCAFCVFRRWWIPDGLHVWVGRRGVHLFWRGSEYQPRVSFDREMAR